jgi:hypothetical protein
MGVRLNGARANAPEGTQKKPEACEGLRSTEGGGSGEGLFAGEIAARETDEAEHTGAEESQGERLWNSGRCVD